MSASSTITALETARDNIAAQLVDLTESPKPSYSVSGRSVSWGEHFNNLTSQLKEINSLINTMKPFSVISRGRV